MSLVNIFELYYEILYFHWTPFLVIIVIIVRNVGFERDHVVNVDFIALNLKSCNSRGLSL
jgi:hypothetical protein